MGKVEIDSLCRKSLFVFNRDLNIKRGITDNEVEGEDVSESLAEFTPTDCAAEPPPSLAESDEADPREKVSWSHPLEKN